MKNSKLKYWILAVRPKTLSASIIPVIVACALAYRDGEFKWVPAVLCLLFAILVQIVSNFLNDYFDFIKGSDRNDRLGPKRMVSNGLIQAKEMLRAAIITMLLACVLGCFLLFYTSLEIIWVGIAVCIGAYTYSSGPYPLAYKGWGDVSVVIFYGIIPLGFSYYVQALDWNWVTTICGLAIGIVSTNILVANNYRDREEDKISNKNTSIVLFGEKFGRLFYLCNGLIVILLCLLLIPHGLSMAAFFSLFYLIPHFFTWKKMCRIRQGSELNHILAESARNTVIIGFLLVIGILLS